MEENFDIWDFALTDDEMAAIVKMDLGRSEIGNDCIYTTSEC